jgi:hypothetical protein
VVILDYDLRFTDRHTYESRAEGITVPAVLRAAGNEIQLLAKVDTGATYCLFERWVAEELGLQVEEGERQRLATVVGGFDSYGHEVSIEVLGIVTTTTVYFFADPDIGRNVLGRRGWLDRLRFGLEDYDQYVYIADYNK